MNTTQHKALQHAQEREQFAYALAKEAATKLRTPPAVQTLRDGSLVPEGWKLVPEDANWLMLESGKKVLEKQACTTGLTAQAVYKAMIYAAPLPPPDESSARPVDTVLQMIRDQEAQKNAFIAEGICPTCKGKGECGGQFQGGEYTCEDCKGTGRYAQAVECK